MLQVAFGQSKYYSDNLSENIKRGFRQKLRRGEWPRRAPFGYVNNRNTRNIEPDPVKARILQKAFKEFAEGKHNLTTIAARLSFWGVVSKSGKKFGNHTIKRILTNPIYLGLIVHNGETYEGTFKPIITRATFEAVQRVFRDNARPRKTKKGHNFPFSGLLKCGECGASITAQFAKGNGGTYKYYRCTKKLGHCSQSYLREDLLLQQLREQLQKVALCEDWKEKMLAQVAIWEKEEGQSSQSFARNLNNKASEIKSKLDKLVNAFLDGIIEKDIYLEKKDELIRQRSALSEQKSAFGRKGKGWLEPLRNWILDAHHAGELVLSKDFKEIKSFTEKIGTNRRLLDKTVLLELKKPWSFLFFSEGDSENSEKKGELCSPKFFDKNDKSPLWWR